MEKIEFNGHFKMYRGLNEFSDDDKALLMAASQALELSYAPYSNFNVGAALLLDNGYIIQGANQENASYPLCICAERVALYNASIQHPSKIITDLAIIARNNHKVIEKPVPPCGACRQVIAEYEQRQQAPIRLLLISENHIILEFLGIESLLPFSFDGTFLEAFL